MKIPTIEIDLDKPCKQCGKDGAMEGSGICLGCMTKNLKAGKYDHIIERTNKKLSARLIIDEEHP